MTGVHMLLMVFKMRERFEGSCLKIMAVKIIGVVFGILAVGIYTWKFKETPLCRP